MTSIKKTTLKLPRLRTRDELLKVRCAAWSSAGVEEENLPSHGPEGIALKPCILGSLC